MSKPERDRMIVARAGGKPPGNTWRADVLASIRALLNRVVALEARPAATHGRDGRSVTAARIADGRLILSYSDGAESDLGRIVIVPDEVAGIANVHTGTDGHLVVTLTDGRALDAGRIVGKDGDDADADAIVDALQPVLRRYVDEVVAKLPPAPAGRSVTVDDVAPLVAVAVGKAVAALPAPEPGRSVTVDDVRPLIVETIAAEMAKLPATPEPIDVDQLTTFLAGEIERVAAARVAAIPAPKDGRGIASATVDRDGRLILGLTDGETLTLPRVSGEDGKPGAGIAEAAIDQDGCLILKTTDGRSINAGIARGKDAIPVAGTPGRSIVSGKVRDDGHLVLRFTDGAEEDAGQVVCDGKPGLDGVGVKTASIDDDGTLRIVLTDGEEATVGRVVGADGRSVTAARIRDGKLEMQFSDGTEADLGQVVVQPAAPISVDDAAIDANGNLTLTFSDGRAKKVGRVVGRDGKGVKGNPGKPGRKGSEVVAGEVVQYGVTAEELARFAVREIVIDGAPLRVLVLE